jgi:hypothetical protein
MTKLQNQHKFSVKPDGTVAARRSSDQSAQQTQPRPKNPGEACALESLVSISELAVRGRVVSTRRKDQFTQPGSPLKKKSIRRERSLTPPYNTPFR